MTLAKDSAVSTSELTCRNHTKCLGCALVRCCPVELETLLQTLKRQRESTRKRISWLNMGTSGVDRRTEAKVCRS